MGWCIPLVMFITCTSICTNRAIINFMENAQTVLCLNVFKTPLALVMFVFLVSYCIGRLGAVGLSLPTRCYYVP